MRDVATVRQQPGFNDLIALCFPILDDLSNAAIEVIDCEWADGYVSSTSGDITADTDYKNTLVDVSAYDWVLIPMFKKGSTTTYSGLCSGAGTSITQRLTAAVGAGYTEDTCYYALMPTSETSNYVLATVSADNPTPVIGIKVSS